MENFETLGTAESSTTFRHDGTSEAASSLVQTPARYSNQSAKSGAAEMEQREATPTASQLEARWQPATTRTLTSTPGSLDGPAAPTTLENAKKAGSYAYKPSTIGSVSTWIAEVDLAYTGTWDVPEGRFWNGGYWQLTRMHHSKKVQHDVRTGGKRGHGSTDSKAKIQTGLSDDESSDDETVTGKKRSPRQATAMGPQGRPMAQLHRVKDGSGNTVAATITGHDKIEKELTEIDDERARRYVVAVRVSDDSVVVKQRHEAEEGDSLVDRGTEERYKTE
ncbi:unnamed protein product [Phytophthora fragariaefolia]|uniref:Unnamed protein product n=1 Tax=Phytophthora fragariaefolia TaxID=1490495 RepID=A0A9W6Y7V3_9STRA|nr:unnamed protein product [Phytophthora fragariaefolia]